MFVVLMRKHVKQARVHVIRKLLKNINLYKNRKGNEAQKAKFTNKANKLLEEVLLLKKLKVDKVSKFALSVEDLNIYNDDSIEIRALKRLSGHKTIIAFVKQFRDKYPGWKAMLPVLRPHGKPKKLHTDKNKNGKVRKEKKNKHNIPDKQVIPALQENSDEENNTDPFFLMNSEDKPELFSLKKDDITKNNSDSFFCVSSNEISHKQKNTDSLKVKTQKLKTSRKEPRTQKLNPSKKEWPPSAHKNMKNQTDSETNLDTGKIHPSWEAKRRLKEKQLTATFTGKKIKFEDE